MATPDGHQRRAPVRVAVVGSGPAGFYATSALLGSAVEVALDMFDRMATPFGLVRFGVAPDHPAIKDVVRVYEKIASDRRFSFWGNVHVGRDVTVDELRTHYDAVVFATGSQRDRRLGIPGEDLPGSHAATDFVGWYNGHPDHRDHTFDLSQEVVFVIGHGNVALDVSRLLARTADELRPTDIAAHAMEALAESRVHEIHVVGRRGPLQAKFTTRELRELGRLADCDVVVDPAALVLSPVCERELAASAEARHKLAALRELAARRPTGRRRRLWLRFCESPIELRGASRVERVVLETNRLEGEPGHQRAVGTGQRSVERCGLVLRSVGYRSVGLPGLPFDERRGVVPNERGRILDGGRPLPGLYVAGWLKRGPQGVIGTNKPDARETVQALLEDVPDLVQRPHRPATSLADLLRARAVRVVTLADWRRIDAAELERGARVGKPREKFTRIEEMLALLPSD